MQQQLTYPQVATAVYQACANYDQYLPEASKPVMLAWAKVFERYRLTVEDLLAAVDKLYAEHGNGWKPLPGDIAQTARALRTERADSQVTVTPALTGAEEQRAAAARLEAMKALAAEKALESAEPAAASPAGSNPYSAVNPLSVSCDHCRAAIGAPCMVAGTNQRLTKTPYHDSRVQKAKAQAVPA
ncbi:hypothetical protein SEA_CRACKLEWINK_85 [Mycobacterium phage Cracklewink]|uniref:DNA-binding phage zinc finger domain-containing protein n=1 Tax=Mycobacterium phage Bipper TaxID=1805457 RepID=A0A142F2L3_9CAUD|nr:hypothetical protein KCH39_gp092 [Mycobacterium phage Bipper]AMQ67020.1 hypothetical protein SEA_BIPPER_85 [Mycobacterium phage Bipper]QDF19371.1 hypothetical protein SEA_CRACKLEWINK_85 [Mycobacterium phage Cracklewink]